LRDVDQIRSLFPILARKVNGQPLVYFDNAATTQKPVRVIEAMSDFYRNANANIHRGVHTLSREATDLYEAARRTVADHFKVSNEQQVIFTAGATDGINLVAQGLAKKQFAPGDEIIVSTYEHHSNILPWQLWAEEHGGILKEIPLTSNQSLEYGKIEGMISNRTKLIATAHVSNTLGLVSDVVRIMKLARQHGIPVLIDGAQSAPHMKVDLAALDPDFFVCSAHKIYGPTGTGMLYMSEKWMKELPLSRSGGGTIRSVTFAGTEYVEGAMKFEPGTPNVAGAIGFAEALRFVAEFGIDAIAAHEHDLVQYAQQQLENIPGLAVYGSDKAKAAVISFNVKDQHPFDVGTLLDKYGIAVRTGHHCTQPLMQCLGVQGTVRISFAVYNTRAEIDFFVEKLKKVVKLLG
jgi:cysteine desulfurase / selenocysteine lyase